MANNSYITYSNIEALPDKDTSANDMFTQVIGNKTDTALTASNTTSLVSMVKYIIANLTSDLDITTLVGELTTVAHTGAVDDLTTIMGYVKQLITDLRVTKGDLDNGGRLDLLIDSILADTNELQSDWTNGGRLDLLIDAIKLVIDALPDAGALTSLAQDSTVAKEITIGTPIDTDIATDINNISTLIGIPVSTDISADIAAIKTVVDLIWAKVNI